ncbi:peptidase S41 [Clostridiales bacterium PH28_bin88]|nr:peptidase S41 [Clostridiales bacterium PH28_bin88]
MERNRLFKLFKALGTFFLLVGLVTTVAGGFLVLSNYQQLGRAVRVISLIKTQALTPPGTSELIDGAMRGMVGALDDPYSVYLDPKDYRHIEQHITGTYGGVGLIIGLDEEKRLVVVSPFKGTPGHRAGILAGDLIVTIDQQDTTGMDLEKAASLMQGQPGTKVTLGIYRKGLDRPKEYAITREVIQVPSVEGKMLNAYPGIAYISLTTFNEHTAQELGKLLEEFRAEQARAFILDLRNNAGGTLGAAVKVADYFVPEGPIVHIVGRFRKQEYKADRERIDLPLAVLVNEGTASASEIVAGAIKDTKAGTVIGEKTFGKGIVQTVFELTGGGALKLTTDKYLTPAKNDIHKKGIEPDVVVPLEGEQESRALLNAPDPADDPQLRKAIEILQRQMK